MEEVRDLLSNHAAACSRRSDSRNAGFRWWGASQIVRRVNGGTSLPSFFFPLNFCPRSTRNEYLMASNFILQNYLFVHMT